MCFFGGCRRDNEPFYPADDNIGSIKDSIKNNFIASYRVYFSLAKKKKKKILVPCRNKLKFDWR